MKIKLLAIVWLCFLPKYNLGQDLYRLIEVDKLSSYTAEIFFQDPIDVLLKKNKNFWNLNDSLKTNLYYENIDKINLYSIDLSLGGEKIKSYVLSNYYSIKDQRYLLQLNIYNSYGERLNTVKNFNLVGVFFENMMIFDEINNNNSSTFGLEIWGKFVKVISYNEVKKQLFDWIKMDLKYDLSSYDTAPTIFNDSSFLKPLFDYQGCAIEKVRARRMRKSIYQYNEAQEETNRYLSSKIYDNIYEESLATEIIGVTSLPYFAADDIIRRSGDTLFITSRQKNINRYLNNIKVIFDPESGKINRIEAGLIIHGYSSSHSESFDENFIAKFGQVGDCRLPVEVMYCPKEDLKYQYPRLKIEIEYMLRE